MPRKFDRSSLQGEVLQIFKTRDVYERRLLNFLGHLKMAPKGVTSVLFKISLTTFCPPFTI